MLVFQNGLRYVNIMQLYTRSHVLDYYKKEPVNCGVLPYKPPEVIVAYLGITA